MEGPSPSQHYELHGSKPAPAASEWYEIIADPASFAIIAFLRNKETQNLNEFKKQLPEDLFELFDSIVGYLERCGMIEIRGSEIKLLQSKFLRIFDFNSISKFLPNLNQEATKIALKNIKNGLEGNSCKFFSIHRNQKNLARVHKAIQNFKNELSSIAADTEPSEDPSKKQFISIINAEISLEDFI